LIQAQKRAKWGAIEQWTKIESDFIEVEKEETTFFLLSFFGVLAKKGEPLFLPHSRTILVLCQNNPPKLLGDEGALL
jgi:hypothetical protein